MPPGPQTTRVYRRGGVVRGPPVGAAVAARHGVERVLFASSRQVYGEPISLPVDEDSPLLAVNSYGASKLAGEAYCRAFRREFGLQVGILRLANVYGPRDSGRVIPLWI